MHRINRRGSSSSARKTTRAKPNSDLVQEPDAGHEVTAEVDAPQSSVAAQTTGGDVQDTSWEMSVGPLAQARGWLAYKVRDAVFVQFVLDDERRSRLFPQLGASDIQLLSLLISQMANAATWTKLVDYRAIRVMIELMQGVAPQDATEIVLAVHKTQIHLALMTAHNHLANRNSDEFDIMTRSVNSLTRTLLSLEEALKRHRSGGEQRVTVRHVSVSDHGQAILGNVSHTTAKQALPNNRKQAPAITHSQQAPIEIIEERERELIPVRSGRGASESSS
jgi:hypothetical protein